MSKDPTAQPPNDQTRPKRHSAGDEPQEPGKMTVSRPVLVSISKWDEIGVVVCVCMRVWEGADTAFLLPCSSVS